MGIFQKWHERKKRKAIEAAIINYNDSLAALSEAAIAIRDIARQAGTSTAAIECAISGICEAAESGYIRLEDIRQEE